MHKIRLKAVALALVLILAVPQLLSKANIVLAEITNEDIDDAKKQKEEIEKRLKAAQAELDKLNSEKLTIENYVKELDGQLEKINAKIYDLSLKMENKKKEIAETQRELDAAKEDEKEQYKSMKLRIQYMYETGQTTYIEAFLASDNIADLLNRTEYVKSITEYDKKMMDKLVETRKSIEAIDEQLKKEYAEYEAIQIENQAELAAAEFLYAEKQKELKAAEEKADAALAAANKVKDERDKADAQVDKLLAQYKAQEDAKKQAEIESNLATKTFLGWPLPTSCRTVTDVFGPRLHPILGIYTNHNGLDLSAKTGTPVYAAADGTVEIAMYNYSYGNYVLLYHEGGVATLYAHASKLLVKEGQKVKKGDVIMLVGSTGYSTGPHLHYEVRVSGTRVDPLKYYNTDGLIYYLY